MRTALLLCLSLPLLAACATTAAPRCPAGLEPRVTAELYFGRNIGPSLGVTDADWTRFVDEEVTPRFPAGLSVADVAGQWRGEDGAIVREPSKALMIVLSGDPGERGKLDAVRAAYRARFRQEAVMLVERDACVGF
ncbi:MAG: DUF3574 domain-containing protein [Caulobacter sp.]|jgi:hypothetical protein|nr:DUF3574 domain-containing protein [Caulobacter sp.]